MAVAFEIFGISVKWYGIIIAFGVLVACLIAMYNCKRKGINSDWPLEILLWCFPLAIIGARLYYIIFSGQSYTFMEAIAIWNGGMAIYGGVIGGVIGLVLYSVIKKRNFLQTLDIAAPSLIIAQSIGRWGNFANQEVYGTIVTDPNLQFFPFAVYIDALNEWHYATFFYESMLNLGGFFLLMWLFKKSNIHGVCASVYLIFYGIVRFFLEGIRQTTEILFIPGTQIMVSQVVSLIFVAIGIVLLCVIMNKHKKALQSIGMNDIALENFEKNDAKTKQVENEKNSQIKNDAIINEEQQTIKNQNKIKNNNSISQKNNNKNNKKSITNNARKQKSNIKKKSKKE